MYEKIIQKLWNSNFFGIPLVTLSCKEQVNEKEVNPISTTISKDVKIDDEMMVFDSENSFKNFRTLIEKKTDEELLAFTKEKSLIRI